MKLDQVLSVMERVPQPARNPYVMESSLSLLKGPRLRRLKDTRCVYVAPGIESWQAYSEKVGVGKSVGRDRLEHLVARFGELRDHVVGLQANFMFGTDVDRGDEPVELTMELMRRLPLVWPTINIPTPFGGTPLYEKCLAQGRILRSMPFSFYYTPYLVTTLEHYHPIEYYEKLADMYAFMTSGAMIVRRMVTEAPPALRMLHLLRSLAMKKFLFAKFQAAQDQSSSAISRLLAIQENYPQLKSNENFLALQNQLEGTENRIAVERRNYNQVVQVYNTAIRKIPGSLVAGFGGFREKQYFKAKEGADTAPQVKF